MKTTSGHIINEAFVLDLLAKIPDPEIPVISITELGIVRDVLIKNNGVTVKYTPTYSGCPAMDMISMQIQLALKEAGIENVKLEQVLSPAWTTEWMTETGKRKLEQYGIAPPNPVGDTDKPRCCPHCGSINTQLLSQFGSTSCKALYQCLSCKEPFEYFKCH